jgi:hypothetical protein
LCNRCFPSLEIMSRCRLNDVVAVPEESCETRQSAVGVVCLIRAIALGRDGGLPPETIRRRCRMLDPGDCSRKGWRASAPSFGAAGLCNRCFPSLEIMSRCRLNGVVAVPEESCETRQSAVGSVCLIVLVLGSKNPRLQATTSRTSASACGSWCGTSALRWGWRISRGT